MKLLWLLLFVASCKTSGNSTSEVASDEDPPVFTNQMRYDSYLGLEAMCDKGKDDNYNDCVEFGLPHLGGRFKDYLEDKTQLKKLVEEGRGAENYKGCSLNPCRDFFRGAKKK